MIGSRNVTQVLELSLRNRPTLSRPARTDLTISFSHARIHCIQKGLFEGAVCPRFFCHVACRACRGWRDELERARAGNLEKGCPHFSALVPPAIRRDQNAV